MEAIIGFLVAVLFGLSAWLGKVWGERISRKETHALQVQLETLRAEQGRYLTHFQHVLAAIGPAPAALVERRIKAVDALWAGMKKLKSVNAVPVGTFALMTSTEILARFKEPGSNLSNHYGLGDHESPTILQVLTNLEDQRPFVGEDAWYRLRALGAFHGRLALILFEAKKTGQLGRWIDDPGIIAALEPVLTTGEFGALKASSHPDAIGTLATMEYRLLQQLDAMLAGRTAVASAVAQTEELVRRLNASSGG